MSQVLSVPAREHVVIGKRPRLTAKVRQMAHDRANGVCEVCGLPVGLLEGVYDHIHPRALTGRDGAEELRPLHKACHDLKFAPDMARIAKAKRQAGETGQRSPNRKPRKKIIAHVRPWLKGAKLRSRPFRAS